MHHRAGFVRAWMVVCSLFVVTTIEAQIQRTFVASTGVDTNPCNRTSPCRNFAAAVTQTLDGGEVVALDSAGYGPVTLSKSITLVSPGGVYAGISVLSGNGVTINPGTGATVVLRNLTLTGLGGFNGINATSVGVLHLENITVSGFGGPSNAISFTSGATPPTQLFVDGCTVRDNNFGLVVTPASGTVNAVVDSSHFENDFDAVEINGTAAPGTTATLVNTTALNTGENGFTVTAGEMNVKGCTLTGTANYAIYGASGGTVTVGTSALFDNATGFVNNGTAFYSYGNNELHGNTADTAGPAITPVSGK